MRYSWWILIGMWVLIPYLFLEAKYAVQSNTNKVTDWIPKTFSETKELGWFRQHFVADQFVVISWEGCELGEDPALPAARPDDPRIEKLAQALVPDAGHPHRTARQVFQEREHGAPRPESHHGTSLERSLRGGGPAAAGVVDRPQWPPHGGCRVSDRRSGQGLPHLDRSRCGRLLTKSHSRANSLTSWRLAESPLSGARGRPPVDNVSIDEEGDKTMVRLVAMAMVFGVGLAWYSLRSIKLTLIVFACRLLGRHDRPGAGAH